MNRLTQFESAESFRKPNNIYLAIALPYKHSANITRHLLIVSHTKGKEINYAMKGYAVFRSGKGVLWQSEV
jgi:hypothetical protein